MKTRLHVLLIEPADANAALVIRHLTEAHFEVTAQRVDSAVSLQAALSDPSWQLVIAQAHWPALPVTAVLDMVQKSTAALPVIVIDEKPQVKTAVSLLQAGASDYLPQEEAARLGTAVQQALAAAQTRTAPRQQHRETAVRQAEAAIAHEKTLSDSLINNLPGIFYLFDEQGKFIRWNDNFEKVSGYSPTEISQLHPLDFFTGADKALIQERISAVFQTGVTEVEANLRTKKGRHIPYYFTGARIQFNNAPCLIGMGIDISKRKKAEKALWELKQAVDASGDVIFLTDKEGLITTINAQFTRLYGYTAEEVVGQTTPRILKSGKQDKTVYEQFWQMILDGEMFRGEVINKSKDGRFVTMEETVNPFLDEEGSITGYLAIQRDVTERREAEKQLRLLSSAIAQSSEGIAVAGLDGNLLFTNETFAAAHGFTPQELLGKHLSILHNEEQMAAVRDANQQIVHTGDFSGEIWHLRRDGAVFPTWMHNSLLKDEQGNPIGLIGTMRDTTERKQAEDELRLQGAALASAANAIVITGVDGTIKWANPAYTRLTGYELAEVIGKSSRIHKSSMQEPAFYKTMWDTVLAGEVWQGELINKRKDGSLYTEEQTITPLQDENGVITYFIAIKQDVTERKQAEQEINRQFAELQVSRKETDFLANLLEQSSQPLGVGFPNGRLKMVNTAFCRLVGYSKEALQTIDWNRTLTPPDWQENELRHLERLAQDDRPVRYEKEYIHKDGRRIPVELFVHLMRDKAGAIEYYYAFITDITERRQHQREQEAILTVSTALRTAANRTEMLSVILDQLDALLQAEGTALVMADPTTPGGAIVEAAHGAFAAAVNRQWPIGEGRSHLVVASGQPSVAPVINHEKGVTCPESFQEMRAVVCVPLLAQDEVIGVIWVGRQAEIGVGEMRVLTAVADMAANAIQRTTLYEQTRKQAEQISHIMQSVPDGVLLLDADYRILLANPPARDYLALLAEAQVGDTLVRLADQPLVKLLTSPPSGRWHDLAQDGRMFEAIARLLASGPTSSGWVLVLRDVTERRLVQRQLHEQEQLAAIGQLAAGIAHDFNNLLAIITLHTDLVIRTAGLDERNRVRLATVQQQVDYAAHMVKQILDFSRRSHLARQPLDLAPLLEKQVTLLQRTLPEHIEVFWVCELDEMLVEADATGMQQVIMNLAVNARDALPQGGRFTLDLSRVEWRRQQDVPVVGMSTGRWARLRAADTGEGISAENLKHIFEPFFTTKTPGKGTGLGLAQVYGIVAQHGGHITVASRVGEGTTFTVYLPELSLTTAPLLTKEDQGERPLGNGELVLVVEDNEMLRASLVEYLRLWRYRVVEAANGEEGLARLAEHEAETALILSDVVMPRLGGMELFQMLNQQGKHIPLILMSGHSLEAERVAALLRQGLYGWLPKPLDMDRLAQLAAVAVARK